MLCCVELQRKTIYLIMVNVEPLLVGITANPKYGAVEKGDPERDYCVKRWGFAGCALCNQYRGEPCRMVPVLL